MILWDDFDRRATKVLCDECHRNISPQVWEAIKHPWRSRLKVVATSALNIFRGQWSLQIGSTRWVLTRFHVNDNAPSMLLYKMKEHKDWGGTTTIVS